MKAEERKRFEKIIEQEILVLQILHPGKHICADMIADNLNQKGIPGPNGRRWERAHLYKFCSIRDAAKKRKMKVERIPAPSNDDLRIAALVRKEIQKLGIAQPVQQELKLPPPMKVSAAKIVVATERKKKTPSKQRREKLDEIRVDAVKANRKAFDEFAAKVMPIIQEIWTMGIESYKGVARELNERRVPTRRGNEWSGWSVFKFLEAASRPTT